MFSLPCHIIFEYHQTSTITRNAWCFACGSACGGMTSQGLIERKWKEKVMAWINFAKQRFAVNYGHIFNFITSNKTSFHISSQGNGKFDMCHLQGALHRPTLICWTYLNSNDVLYLPYPYPNLALNLTLTTDHKCGLSKLGTCLLIRFTQISHIIVAAAFRQFSAIVCSHRAKLRHHKDKSVCNSHRKMAPQILKRCGGTHHDDVCGFFRVFLLVSTCQNKHVPVDSL